MPFGRNVPAGLYLLSVGIRLGGIRYWELFGLGAEVPSCTNLVLITECERTEAFPHIPHPLIPICNNGGGDHYCLDTSRLMNGQCPVVYWDHEQGEDQVPDKEADSFEEWLQDMVLSSTQQAS